MKEVPPTIVDVESVAAEPPDPLATPPIETVAVARVGPAPPLPTVRPTPPKAHQTREEPKHDKSAKPPAQFASKASKGAQTEEADTNSTAGDQGISGTQSTGNVGAANNTSGGGVPGELVDYMSALQAWLERYKEYPRRAQSRRQQGTALLHFVMDRRGHVLTYRIEESSGHHILDREVEAMIERAQPLPTVPDGFSGSRLELRVPIQFFLR